MNDKADISSHAGEHGHGCGGSMPSDCHADPDGKQKRYAIIGVLLTVPLVAFAMAGSVFVTLFGPGVGPVMMYGQWALATLLVFWIGWPFLTKGLGGGATNMFTLISIGVLAAYGYSTIGVLFPDLFPPPARGSDGKVGLYFEAAGVIITLVLWGQILESGARRQTDRALRALARRKNDTACRIDRTGREEIIPLGAVRIGDQLRLRPGEYVPVDGLVVSGSARIDASMISGESRWLAAKKGVVVRAGTINLGGSIVVEAHQVGEQTLLARVVRLAEQARSSRPSIQRLVDRVSRIFVPAVIIIAACAFIAFAAFGLISLALVAAVSVLIVACPCALGLATPVSLNVGIGRGAANGILVRDARTLEKMGKIDTVIVDKTGTLTRGEPTFHGQCTVAKADKDRCLALAGAVESYSDHPLAAPVVAKAKQRGLPMMKATNFHSGDGGVSADVGGQHVRCGNRSFVMAKASPVARGAWGECLKKARAWQRRGSGVIFISLDHCPLGVIAVFDPPRRKARDVLDALRRRGLDVVMLTGDHASVARYVGTLLGITTIQSEVLPTDKHRFVKRMQERGHVVAMVGDGINDAPALALADVSIAMGGGTDAAIESAGMTLIDNDLGALVRGYDLSRAVMRNIRQNLFFAFAYNTIAIAFAAGVLYPFFGKMLDPMVAAMAMTASSLCVIANALRLRFGTRE